MAGIDPPKRRLTAVSGVAARSSIAAAIATDSAEIVLGRIRLHPHQAEAVGLLRRAIGECGGALLCDPVGTGKTFTALAVASRYSRVVVVAPAVLREMWKGAAAKAGIVISFVSHEQLSRRSDLSCEMDFLIVDEAHHARNPATKRFSALAALASAAEVLLLTATPIHNRPRDLQAILSLFLGSRAAALTESEIAELVVRREEKLPATSHLPDTGEIQWLSVGADDEIAELLLGLPPPLPPRMGSEARTLVIDSLVRLWASSDAALAGGLRRRRQRAHALMTALESGTYPSRRELAAWLTPEDGVQLGFAELLAPRVGETGELLSVIRTHAAAVERLLGRLKDSRTRDGERAAVVRDIRSRHREASIVAFSRYSGTVESLYRSLAADGGVAMLSGRGGRVTGGSMTRGEVLRRFAPRASSVERPPPGFRISLLLTTDILSEGVNLQDAECVIHLDLPFTHARMEQRLGRIARLGSLHPFVWQYAFHPPASAEVIARIEGLIGAKLGHSLVMRASPRAAERVRSGVGMWRTSGISHGVVATVASDRAGFLAAVRIGGECQLICSIDDCISGDPDRLLVAIAAATGADRRTDVEAVECAVKRIEMHFRAEAALLGARSGIGVSAAARSRMLRRIARILRNARPHLRPSLTILAVTARDVVRGRLGAGAEADLARIDSRGLSDMEWLECVATCGARKLDRAANLPMEVAALILFGSDSALR